MKTLIISLALSMVALGSNSYKIIHVNGIIGEAVCNQASGLGYLSLEKREGNTIVKNYLRVNSKALCGLRTGRPIPGNANLSFFGRYNYERVFTGKAHLFELTIHDGFVIAAKIKRNLSYDNFRTTAPRAISKNDGEVIRWFFSGPSNIPYSYLRDQAALSSLVERYTSKAYLSSF